MFNSLLHLVTLALAASALTTPSPSRTTATGINPSVESIATPLASLIGRGLNTNARRFAAGFPPVAPRPRAHQASRAVPSGTPLNVGYISVVGSDGTNYGYLSRQLNSFGEYGLVTPNVEEAIRVTFDVTDSRHLDLVASNSQLPDLSFLGGVVGFASTSDSLSSGSYDYVYLSATTNTPPLSVPVALDNAFTRVTNIPKDIESAVWEFDAATSTISPQWVNPDSSLPSSTLVYVQTDSAIVIVGDIDAFTSVFGPAPTVTFKFVAA